MKGLQIESLPDPDGAAATVSRAVRKRTSARGMGNLSLGSIEVDVAEVRVRTNSERRADRLRSRIEAACRGLLAHTGRERRDIKGMLAAADGLPAGGTEDLEDGEQDALILELKKKRYAAWPDEPVPALGGVTPREASRRAGLRRALVALLNDFELSEAREPAARRFDVDELRHELGLK